ncbi:uncharacterized protein MONOS_15186 [Monocercomonoides exilis]|uniref:uncharacterized protein n=1 Tax=Monocercomonoides exilis TaxID=2049356 RepID=UPI0035595DB5|nr:hypothetical protein MONOS_15186 [Monocercomonoides exilis]|eukprot:MONOS_15186.1-p1 / transcript=MONOS_15186.1 / gene=MONOS_15186 / organism=Monocercomonoides_exilis_PA203 / gene_product=unspecified product / transcript_product=unspecified product / location=Mono_scaffold01164:13766-14469(-) / protein_length=79 / sequence_SO=supercontig / SO=protein_coding / is_pseudo=false
MDVCSEHRGWRCCDVWVRSELEGVPTAMELLTRKVSGWLKQEAHETAYVLRMPPARQSSIQMQRVLTPLKKELQLWVM